jgi:GT2 family glycosyltransferase
VSFSIVILSKNASNVDACVDSIRAAGEECRIIVVDDGLDWEREDCLYLNGPQPFIFARNANLGLGSAFGSKDTGAFLLNDDTRLLTAGGLSLLASADLKNCGVVSCAITDHVGNLQQLPRGLGLRAVNRVVAFVAVYIPKSTWELVGPFDERFGIPPQYGWEDNDYCRRVRNKGLKLGVFDHCIVEHGKLPSTSRPENVSVPIGDGAEIYRQKWGDLG